MKDTYVHIRMSEKDKQRIQKGAEREQMSMSEYILTLVRIDAREHGEES